MEVLQRLQEKKRLIEEINTKKLDKIQNPLWIKLNVNYFDSLTQDFYNSLNNDKFKATVDGKAYDLKNAKKFLVKITTEKISEKEALKLYSDLIIPDIAALEKSKSKSKDDRNSILTILRNLESVFTGVYLHYDNVSEPESKPKFEENIAERTKL